MGGEGGGGSGEIPENGDGGPPPQRGGLPNPATAPQPAIETISPAVVIPEGSVATVTVKGFNFVRKSLVYFNGKTVPYQAVSSTELRVMLDASSLRTPGKFDILVQNPGPVATAPEWGSGASNMAHLLVNFKY